MVSADYSLYWVRRENVSWHEAAHTAIGTKLGCRIERVQLFPGLQDDGSTPEGITRFNNFHTLARVDQIKTLLAGPLCEKKSGSGSWQRSEDDFRRIATLLRGSGGLNLEDLIAETERLLTQWSTEIELRPWCSQDRV